MPSALDRRAFLQWLSALGLVLLPLPLSASAAVASAEGPPPSEIPRRRLGRTGLRVSTIGLNFAHEIPANVVDFALDLGINYFDTARRYRQGAGELELAPILARRRDEVIIASKWHRREGANTAEDVLAALEQSLEALGTDRLDVWLSDSVADADQVTLEPWLEAASRAKEQGKARFVGLSAWEGDLPDIARAAAESGAYDVLHLRYIPADLDVAQRAIEEAGLGLVAMYVLSAARDGSVADITVPAGRRDAVAWALGDERIACALVETPGIDDVRLCAEGAMRADAPRSET